MQPDSIDTIKVSGVTVQIEYNCDSPCFNKIDRCKYEIKHCHGSMSRIAKKFSREEYGEELDNAQRCMNYFQYKKYNDDGDSEPSCRVSTMAMVADKIYLKALIQLSNHIVEIPE